MSWGCDFVATTIPAGSGAFLKWMSSVRGGSKSAGPSPVWSTFGVSVCCRVKP